MKSLHRPGDLAEVLRRLRALTPATPRRWGRMSAHQAVCHLADAFRSPLGERDSAPAAVGPVTRGFFRLVALHTPVPWRRGAPTLPEFDQLKAGTPPRDFEQDVTALEELVHRFADHGGRGLQPHPLFGRLSPREWGVWGYRHMDHHLRQFGT